MSRKDQTTLNLRGMTVEDLHTRLGRLLEEKLVRPEQLVFIESQDTDQIGDKFTLQITGIEVPVRAKAKNFLGRGCLFFGSST